MISAHILSTVTAGMLGAVTFFLAALFAWRFAVVKKFFPDDKIREEAVFGLLLATSAEGLHNLFIVLARANLIGWHAGEIFDKLTACVRIVEIVGCLVTCRAFTRTRYGERLWGWFAVAVVMIGVMIYFNLKR